MTNYLILRDKVTAFRADPEVQEALVAAKLPELAKPTLNEGETWSDLAASTGPSADELADYGAGFEHLDQLALEYLYGVRGA
jgi:xylose isomerase